MNRRKMAGMPVAAILLLAAGAAQADITIDTVRVGNAGNTGEWSGESYGGVGPDRICGAVNYEYNIGKYEVTAGQYCAFLNVVAATDTYGLYNANMDSSAYGCQITRHGASGSHTYDFSGRPSGTEANDWANRPVNYVSFGDSVRFANWLTNGQGNGSTETGAYNLDGAMTNGELIDVVVPNAAQRATWSNGAKPYFLLPSEDEWYKAAYHDKTAGLAATYFDYATSSNSTPGYVNDSGNLSGTRNPFTEGGTDPGNYATYDGAPGYYVTYDGDAGTDGIGSPYYRTVVGEWENSDSPYGTFDQGGNVWERNEAIWYGSSRGLRGGSFLNSGNNLHASSRRYDRYPTFEILDIGFRVSAVPEPASMAILALGSIGMLLRRRGLRS